MIASVGGFLGRKGDGEPGTTAMWRGLQYLEAITGAYTTFKSVHGARASPKATVLRVGNSRVELGRVGLTTRSMWDSQFDF